MLFAAFGGVHAQETPDYIVEAIVDNPVPFVGQQITYRFRILTAVAAPPSTRYIPPGFEGFWRSDMGQPITYSTQIAGRSYAVTEVDTALFPLRADTLTIEAATLILEATVFRPEEVLRTATLTVDVQPLPAAVPAGEVVAVGVFEMTAAIDRQVVPQGEPLTVQVTVRGTGNVEQLALMLPDLPDGWRVFDDPPVYSSVVADGQLIGEKVFEWVLLPSVPGEQILPAIALPFFEPENETYTMVSTEPVVVMVEASEVRSASEVTEDAALQKLELKPVGGISTGLNIGGWLGVVLWLLPPLFFLGIWQWSRRRGSVDVSTRRQKLALTTALDMLSRAKRQTDTSRAVDKPVDGMRHDDLVHAMVMHGIAPAVQQTVLDCLTQAEDLHYGPAGQIDVDRMVEQTIDTLKAVDKQWS
jgi:hypothetical protein